MCLVYKRFQFINIQLYSKTFNKLQHSCILFTHIQEQCLKCSSLQRVSFVVHRSIPHEHIPEDLKQIELGYITEFTLQLGCYFVA